MERHESVYMIDSECMGVYALFCGIWAWASNMKNMTI